MFSNVDIFSQDKIRELKERLNLSSIKPGIIALQEVKAKNMRYERTLTEYNMDGYEIIEKNVINSSEGRGMLMYIRKDLPFTEVCMNQSYCEYQCVELMSGRESIMIASIYRSPRHDMDEFEKLYGLILEMGAKTSKHKIVVGDFNLPAIDWDLYTTQGGVNSMEFKFIETVRDCFMTQYVKEITRFRGDNQGSILDLILANSEDIVENVRIECPLGRSDHACVKFDCNIVMMEQVHKKKYICMTGLIMKN